MCDKFINYCYLICLRTDVLGSKYLLCTETKINSESFPKNQNVDFKFSAYAQYRNIGKRNNLRVFGSNTIKGPKPDSKIIIQGTYL